MNEIVRHGENNRQAINQSFMVQERPPVIQVRTQQIDRQLNNFI